MIGDMTVQFIIAGRNGLTVTLTRTEAEHLQKQLKIVLRKTGKTQLQKEEPVRDDLLRVEP